MALLRNCACFCAILSIIGSIFLAFLGSLISWNKYINWQMVNKDKTQIALFICSAIYFVFFILSLAYRLKTQNKQVGQVNRSGNYTVQTDSPSTKKIIYQQKDVFQLPNIQQDNQDNQQGLRQQIVIEGNLNNL